MAYEKNVWTRGDLISADKLNHIEDGIEDLGKTKADIDGVYPKLIAGGIVETETKDEVFTYKVSEHTGIANLNSIKGNTIVWNQLVPNVSESGEWNGLTVTNNGDGSLTINGTYTGESTGNLPITLDELTLLASHKYLIDLHSTALPTYNIRISTSVTFVTLNSNGWRVGSPTSDRTGRLIYRIPASTVFNNITITPQIFDITALGIDTLSDNEVYQWFAKYFPLPYYAYESGKLLSFNGTGIKTTNAYGTEESTTSLPTSTYFPTGMKRAGNAYDELTPTKATTRIGIVDLGTLTWSYQSGNGRFQSSSLSAIIMASTRNFLSTKYEYGSTTSVDQTIQIGANGNVYIRDFSYDNDVTAFKASLNGVYLYYELATPTEVDVDLDLTYRTYEGGTEQLLPVNTDVPVTSPISMNVEFDFGENLNARLNKMLSCLAQVETSPSTHNYSVGQYLMYEYQLYKVTSAITTGQSLTVGTNITATTVMSELLSLTA